MIGKVLDRYKIVDRLGKGGMGEVWIAEDTRLQRRVAIKMLPPEFAADRERLARFEREARAVAALSHPNIVTLHDIQEADHQVFLVMELVDGRDLSKVIPEGGLDESSFFDLAIPLAGAVAAAHEQGVVHRDLKPNNVMVTPDGVVKVLDFGLAKALDDAPSDEAGQTASPTVTQDGTTPGSVLGTTAYMSPEQARAEPVDTRSDIFSLGVLLYEMASGARPFKGKSTAELFSSILRDGPAPLVDSRPELPPRLARIIHRCLEKDAGKRFQSALDLRHELADLRQESSSSVISAPAAVVAPAPGKRWLLGLAGVAVLAILATVVVVMVGHDSSPPDAAAPPTVADKQMIVVFPFENLGPSSDDYFAAGIADEITSRLATLGGLGVVSRTSATQYDRTGKTMAQIAEDLGVDYVLEGTVRWEGSSDRVRVTPQLVDADSDTQMWSSTYDEQLEEIFAVQSDIAERVVQALDVTLGEGEREALRVRPTENLEAYQLYLRAIAATTKTYYSEEHRRETIALIERAVGLDPDFALAWSLLSSEHSYLYHLRYDATSERCEAAKHAADRALALQPDLPEAHFALGVYHYRCFRDYESALPELLIAQEGRPSDANVVGMLAAIQRRQGRWEESLATSKRAIRLNPRNSTTLWDTGVTASCMRRYEEARRYCDRAIAVAPKENVAYSVKAMVYLREGKPEEALSVIAGAPDAGNPFSQLMAFLVDLVIQDYDAALQRARSFPVDIFEGTTALVPRTSLEARALEALGDPDSAREAWRISLATLEREIEQRPDDARAYTDLGLALAGLGRKEEALAAGRRAVKLYPVSLDAFHGTWPLIGLAQIYVRVGEIDEAMTLVDQLLEMPSGIHLGQIELLPEWGPVREHPGYTEMIERHRR